MEIRTLLTQLWSVFFILYPLRFFGVFKGFKMGTLAKNGLDFIAIHSRTDYLLSCEFKMF